jgi:hypothetical protein
MSESVLKKCGRKPKGGKLTTKSAEPLANNPAPPNIILHLKCSLSDLNTKVLSNELVYTPVMPPEIQTYNGDEINSAFSEYEKKTDSTDFAYAERTKICNLTNETEEQTTNMKDINYKLKQLKFNLYKNTIQDKKSACFWCTYEFDNPACYIPKYEMNEKLFGYGSFCRPECAVAYLMKENLDDSTKFEQYHLLNQIYSKVYDYKKNIKPAPDPHYLLEKFFGNLTIQEYRRMLKTENLLMVLNKPMTRVMPELFEDSDNFIVNVYGSSSNATSAPNASYKVKRQSESQNGPSKSNIIREKLGM